MYLARVGRATPSLQNLEGIQESFMSLDFPENNPDQMQWTCSMIINTFYLLQLQRWGGGGLFFKAFKDSKPDKFSPVMIASL